ncbi:MAG: sortase [Patescibacteria group bacterium]
MKEVLIFILICIIVLGVMMIIFNGRFIYMQIKYSFIGPPPASDQLTLNQSELQGIINLVLPSKEYLFPDRLLIPSLNIEAPVVLSQNPEEKSLQADLEKGVIFLPGSTALNENGTMVIMGHSSAYPWYKGQYGSIFALLNKLNIGDEIIVLSKQKSFVYRVEGKEIKAPKDLIFQKDENNSVLYLVSCWPVNTAWKRIVVKTVQVLDNN